MFSCCCPGLVEKAVQGMAATISGKRLEGQRKSVANPTRVFGVVKNTIRANVKTNAYSK